MHRFEESFSIRGRSPEEVFDFISDPDHGADWVSAAREVWAEGEPGEGREIHAKAGLMGVSFEAVSVVTAHERPAHYAFAGDKPFHMGFDFRLSGTDDGTQVDATFDTDPGKFFKIGGRMVAKTLEKQFKNDLKSIKRHLEA